MSKASLLGIILALIIFGMCQQALIRGYEGVTDQLDTALSKCAGIVRTQ